MVGFHHMPPQLDSPAQAASRTPGTFALIGGALLIGMGIGYFVGVSSEDEGVRAEVPAPEVTADPEETNGLTDFNDPVTGISFSYPPRWGAVSIGDERGACGADYKEDPCNFRYYSFKELQAAGIFLVAETKGHAENPVGRGAFWGDNAGSIDEDYQEKCGMNTHCTLIENSQGLVLAKYTAMIFDYGEGLPDGKAYEVYSSQGPYYGILLSPLRIKGEGTEIEKTFEETVVHTLKLSSHY